MNPAFAVVFSVFVILMVGLVVTAVRWGMRRDREERARRRAAGDPPAAP